MARHRDDHNREALEYLEAESIDACLADTRFKNGKEPAARNKRKDKEQFTQSELTIDRDGKTCRCPARACAVTQSRARLHWPVCVMPVQAYEKDCASCGLRHNVASKRTPADPTPNQCRPGHPPGHRGADIRPCHRRHRHQAVQLIEANAGWVGKGSR